MADEISILSLEGDAGSLMSALDEAEAGLAAVDEGVASLAATAGELTGLDEMFASLMATLSEFEAALAGAAEMLTEVAAAGAEVATTGEAAGEAAAGLSEEAAAAGEAASALADAAAAGSEVATTGEAAGEAASGLSEEAAAAGEAAGAVSEHTAATTENTAAQKENTIATAENKTQKEEDALINADSAASMGAVSAMLGLVTMNFLDMGTQAQTSMQTLFDLTGASKQDIAAYSTGLQQMALDIGVSMDEAAKGMYFVASAGYDAANGGMNVLTYAMKAAKAGGADMMTVADALTSAMRAYGATSNEAAAYTDTLIGAVALGKQTFTDLAGAIGPAATTGKAAGFAFKEVASAEALMTQSGFDAHRAVMDLDFLMRAVGINIATVAKNAKSLGLSFDEAKFKTMDLHDRLMYLQQITKGNTADFEKLVGGANGFMAASLLAADGGKNYADMLKQMDQQIGITDKAFEQSETTLSAHFEKIKAILSVISYQIVQAISPTIGPLLDKLGNALKGVADFITHNLGAALPILMAFGTFIGGTLVVGITAAAAAFLLPAAPIIAIIAAISALVGGIIALVTHWKQITSALSNIGFFKAIGDIFSIIGSAVRMAADAFQAVFFPIHAVTAAAKPLLDSFDRATAVTDGMRHAWDEAHKAVTPLLDTFDRAKAVVDGWQKSWAKAHQAINPFVGIFKSVASGLSALGGVLRDIGSFLMATFKPVWDQLVATWSGQVLPLFKQLWAAIEPLEPLFKALGGIILAVVLVALGLLTGALGGVVKVIAIVVGDIASAIAGIVQVFTGVVQVVSGILKLLYDLITGNFKDIGKDLQTIGSGIANIVGGIFQTIGSIIHAVFGGIIGFVGTFVQGFIGFFQHLASVLVGHSIVPDLVNGILKLFLHLAAIGIQIIANLVGEIISGFFHLIGTVIAAVGSWVGDIVSWFLNLMVSAIEHITGLKLGVLHHIADMIGQGIANIASFVGNLIGKFGDLVARGVSLIGSLPGKIGGILGGLASSALQWGADIIGNFISGITSKVGGLFSTIGGIAHNIASMLHFSKPDVGPLSDADEWMPHFGDLLVKGLNETAVKVGQASLNVASNITQTIPSNVSVASYNAATLSATSPSNDPIVKVLQQILTEIQRSNQQAPGRAGIGVNPLNANYAAVNQYNTLQLPPNVNAQSLYQQLNVMAGRAYENGVRGAPVGLG